jgi:hypothetical protein
MWVDEYAEGPVESPRESELNVSTVQHLLSLIVAVSESCLTRCCFAVIRILGDVQGPGDPVTTRFQKGLCRHPDEIGHLQRRPIHLGVSRFVFPPRGGQRQRVQGTGGGA